MNKILLIDKPTGWTSFDVVAKIRAEARKISGNKKIKVGHAGTLDPFATGLLIVLIGNETKNQDSYMKQDKEYIATLRLGFMSTTGDPEGVITAYTPRHSEFISEARGNKISKQGQDDKPFLKDIEGVLQTFLGEIEQIPPIYSAIKIDGRRAYKLAREGKKPEMKPRGVTIYKLKIDSYIYPKLKIIINCSSGTYIRTLAEDIGKALRCGGYLTELRRIKIGNYSITKASTIPEALLELSNSQLE